MGGAAQSAVPQFGQAPYHGSFMSVEAKCDSDLIAEFEVWLRTMRGSSSHTVTAYLSDLRSLRATLGGRGLMDATEQDLAAHQVRLRSEGLSSATRSRAHAAIRQFYAFLIECFELPVNPAQHLERPRRGSPLPKALTERQVRAFLDAAAEGNGPLAVRDKAVCEVLYGTGVRQGELVGMTLPNLDMERGEALIVGKGGVSRVLPLMGTFHEALAEYLDCAREPLGRGRGRAGSVVWLSRNGAPMDRKTVVRIVERVGERAGLQVTPHMLRHSIAVHLLERGADLMDLKTLLGHKRVETTTVYARMSRRAVHDAYHEAHPRSDGEL